MHCTTMHTNGSLDLWHSTLRLEKVYIARPSSSIFHAGHLPGLSTASQQLHCVITESIVVWTSFPYHCKQNIMYYVPSRWGICFSTWHRKFIPNSSKEAIALDIIKSCSQTVLGAIWFVKQHNMYNEMTCALFSYVQCGLVMCSCGNMLPWLHS